MGLEDDEGGRHGRRRVRDRLGPTSPASSSAGKVCIHWRAGRCSRFPCRYLHSELPEAPPKRLRPSHKPSAAAGGGGVGGNCVVSSTREKPCKFFLSGDCRYGDECRCYLHAGSINDGFSLLTPLRGHQKERICCSLAARTERCASGIIKRGRSHQYRAGGRLVGCVLSERPMLFVGIPDAVKIWDTGAEMSLSEPTGEYMHWRLAMRCSSLQYNYTKKDSFELASSLVGHHRIRAWDLAKLQWTHPFWSYRSYNALALLGSISIILFSGSNNQGLGCYGKLETGSLAVTYTHNEDHGALALAGMQDAQLNPILLWSTNYNIVHLYELPSFAERGKISFEAEVGAVKNGPGGLIFTSDEIGEPKVWKWTTERTSGLSN
uniref:C3H1-type domain-containing protein n=1 Tax=Oryza meridionalis TaxID=40149 RepID=A0A0E0DHF9_9ORYZ